MTDLSTPSALRAGIPFTIIIGAGLAGLAAAIRLQEAGEPFLIFDSEDAPGGRVRTDRVEGFLLDRGFQVLLTAYPEAKRLIRFEELDLQPFYPGAYLARENGLELLADPWRRPMDALKGLGSASSTWADRVRVALLRSRSAKDPSPPGDRDTPAVSTREFLGERGFSQRFLESFFLPFFRGIFLERDLETSAHHFAFIFGMMARGDTCIPRKGMQEIPKQLASRLPAASIRLHHRCAGIESNRNGGGVAHFRVGDDPGQQIAVPWSRLILAVEEPVTARLLAWPEPQKPRETTCIYFTAKHSPLRKPALVLFQECSGPVNHLAVVSDVSADYAPPGEHLIAANIVGPTHLEGPVLLDSVRRQLIRWFGPAATCWQHLRTVRVPFAQPNQDARRNADDRRRSPLPQGIHLAGDYVTDASINGALLSGTRAAEAVLRELTTTRSTSGVGELPA